MHQFFQVIFGGVADATALTIIAMGFIVIFRGTGVFNFAHGQLMVLAPYVAYQAHEMGAPVPLALLIGLAVSALVGMAMYRFVLKSMIGAPIFTTAIVTLGIGIILDATVSVIWGGQNEPLPGNFKNTPVKLPGNFRLSKLDVIGLVLTVALLVILELWLRRTRQGLRFRAVSESPLLSSQFGVGIEKVQLMAWAIGGALAGVAGLLIAAGNSAYPGLSDLALVAFPAAILAGMISLPGTLIGALIIAEARSTVGFYYTSRAIDSISYLVLIVILIAKPTGLFSHKEVVRV